MLTWNSFLWSFVAAGIIVLLIGIIVWAGGNSFNLQNWRWRVLLVVYIFALIPAQVGFAALEANRTSEQAAAAALHQKIRHDLILEGWYVVGVDIFSRPPQATVAFGPFGCELTFSPERTTYGTGHLYWWPWLPAKVVPKQVVTPRDFDGLKNGCQS